MLLPTGFCYIPCCILMHGGECRKQIPCTKESQLFPVVVPATSTPNNDAVLRGPSLMMISWIRRSNAFDSTIESIQLPVTSDLDQFLHTVHMYYSYMCLGFLLAPSLASTWHLEYLIINQTNELSAKNTYLILRFNEH